MSLEKPSSHKLIIAGGGTGGHVLAGISVADAWKKEWGPAEEIVFVGAEGGIETRLVPKNGYPLKLIKLGSLNRVSIWKKIKTSFKIPFALASSIKILLSFRPQYVLGVGGYASGPILLVAKILATLGLLKTKTAILEQNSVPGFTNRILSHFADLVLAAFPGVESQFPGKQVVVTGNPVRSAIQPLPSAPKDSFTVFIFGGSQGALGMNTVVLESLPYLKDLREQIHFIHQTGEKDYERVLKAHQEFGTQSRVEKFVDDMPAAYSVASLLICRAGSSTLSEIAAVRRAAILVPLPTASDNHQERNASLFHEAGAAFLFSQKEGGKALAYVIRDFYENRKKIEELELKVGKFFRPHAAKDVVRELSKC